MKKLTVFIMVSIVMLPGCASIPITKPQKTVNPPAQEDHVPTPILVQQTTTEAPTVQGEVTVPPAQYEPLIYGANLPLVCNAPLLAQGALSARPNMQIMWENYLYDRPAGIWGEIGGLVEVNGNLPFEQGQWTNACTVRFSHMLNKAGHKIPRVLQKTVSGGNGDQYYFRFADLEAYLIETYGVPDLAIIDGTANQFDLPLTPGIVLLDLPNSDYTGHATIWNGAGTVDGANIGGYRVLFWHLPCFIPAERTIVKAGR